MPYRLVGHAEDQIDDVLLDSARRWGVPAAARYHCLILAAAAAVGDMPAFPGSREVPRLDGLRTFHLRFARGLVAAENRVASPRHLLVYRVASDGVAEVLSAYSGDPERPIRSIVNTWSADPEHAPDLA